MTDARKLCFFSNFNQGHHEDRTSDLWSHKHVTYHWTKMITLVWRLLLAYINTIDTSHPVCEVRKKFGELELMSRHLTMVQYYEDRHQ
ncbi:hypothetical protein TNCV_3726181 [Trichonephila clavipes]|nr:hypothetical protein TNCV_3726181 [Trichonephila clavipes]